MSTVGTITIENAQLVMPFRNFAGREGQYNAAGEREFSIYLDEENAARLAADGWNVKYLKARDEDDQPQPILTIKVSYKYRPPTVIMIAGSTRTKLNEDDIEVLDYAEIKLADLIISPSVWNVGGKTGIKAYLKSLYVTIEQDDLERKYALMEEG